MIDMPITVYFNINERSLSKEAVDSHSIILVIRVHVLYLLIVYVPLYKKQLEIFSRKIVLGAIVFSLQKAYNHSLSAHQFHLMLKISQTSSFTNDC